MTHPQSSKYLESKVLTASQPDLQLMLLDGAIQSGEKAAAHWEHGNHAEADSALDKAMQFVEELVQSVAEGQTELAEQLEEQYAYAYRTLTSARANREAKELDRVIGFLRYQRETWRLARERVRDDAAQAPSAPAPSTRFGTPSNEESGLSLEA